MGGNFLQKIRGTMDNLWGGGGVQAQQTQMQQPVQPRMTAGANPMANEAWAHMGSNAGIYGGSAPVHPQIPQPQMQHPMMQQPTMQSQHQNPMMGGNIMDQIRQNALAHQLLMWLSGRGGM